MFGSDIIRVKVKGFLKNITEEDNLFFNEKGISNKNKISFIFDDTKYNIKHSNNEVIMVREGKDFINTFIPSKDIIIELFSYFEKAFNGNRALALGIVAAIFFIIILIFIVKVNKDIRNKRRNIRKANIRRAKRIKILWKAKNKTMT